MCKEKKVCGFLFLLGLLLCSAWGALHGQEQEQLSLIPGILNDCDLSILNLEQNMKASNQIITDLQKTVSSMQTTINLQQRELEQGLINSEKFNIAAQMKYQNYEDTLVSLETSLTTLTAEGQQKDQKILKLTENNHKQSTALWIMGIALFFIFAGAVIFIIIKIKTKGHL
jgi:hypothetical protein